jgi:butyrate kinase
MSYRVLAINPGSTSTKIAVYDGDRPVFEKVLRHEPEELAPYPTIIDQYDFRRQLVMEAMRENQVPPSTLHAVVGRGGFVRPVCGGTWKITPQMLEDLKDTSRWGRIHASNLGAFIADAIAKELNIPAFIVDPVVVDEFDEIARISGIPEIERKSLLHALNLRYIAGFAPRNWARIFIRPIRSAFTWVAASPWRPFWADGWWTSTMPFWGWDLFHRKELEHCRLATCLTWLTAVNNPRKNSLTTFQRTAV